MTSSIGLLKSEGNIKSISGFDRYQNEIQQLVQLFKDEALAALCLGNSFPDIQLTDLKNPEHLVYGHFVSIILLAGANLRLLFKVHFSLPTSRFFAGLLMPEEGRSVSAEEAHDFMRELSNLIGGNCKTALDNVGIHTGLSLPLVTRGFHEIFSRRFSRTVQLHADWEIGNEDKRLVCSLLIESPDKRGLDRLSALSSRKRAEIGAVELF